MLNGIAEKSGVVRFLSVLLLMLFTINVSVAEAAGNSRYAAYVIDVHTGKVLHSENADAIRHPASLTKMMTLYMTFEALKRGKLRLQQNLKVSKHASGMPQTNIALRPSSKITVDQAIRSLVVRSANDAAVVLGESISGSEWKFAVAMTNRARSLGMRQTVFKNANGLPDSRQVTTASDMAKLGIALRRDFPEYYSYFKTTDFYYNGRNYHTHNHVMVDFKGADGIKTGYINASGFNLVTSAQRDGYSIVGVVLGGKTSRSRDAHMKDLLTRAFRKLAASRKPIRNPQIGRAAQTRNAESALNRGAVMDVSEKATPARAQPQKSLIIAQDSAKTPQSLAGQNPSLAWGIQVGAFSDARSALLAAVTAQSMASSALVNATVHVQDPNGGGAGRIYRARIIDISEQNARKACTILIAKQESCFVYRVR